VMQRGAPLIAETAGHLVRLVGVPGWLARRDLGPCRSCGGRDFALVNSYARTALGTVQRPALRCLQCLPVDPRKSERLVVEIWMPERRDDGKQTE
jgi:hypothetical protein